jgi:hypothetical protein
MGLMIYCLVYLIMEDTRSSETSVNFQRTTCRNVPQERTLHSHLKSYKKFFPLFLYMNEIMIFSNILTFPQFGDKNVYFDYATFSRVKITDTLISLMHYFFLQR